MKRRIASLILVLSFMLCGCSSILERSYTAETEHVNSYHVQGNSDILTASNYQEIINTIFILLEAHAEEGIIRIPITDGTAAEMARNACDEIQNETALGAYLLNYISCTGSLDPRYYELHIAFSYRRSESQQRAMIHATSLQALPDLIRSAWKKESKYVTFIFNSPTDVEAFTASAEAARETLSNDATWKYSFYPNKEAPTIAEITFDK